MISTANPQHTRYLAGLSLFVFILLWHGIASWLATPVLPEPINVAEVLWSEIYHGDLLHHLGMTLFRLTTSFIIAMILGSALGILLGRTPAIDHFFDNWLIIFLNIPALVTIILCYVWFGLSEVAAILAVVINKLPNVIVTLREGAKSLDKDLLEMAQSYRLTRKKILTQVIWPQLHPYFMAAARSGIALTWKIVLVVELLGRSDGMGFQLHLFFQLFDVASILAYTIAFITVIQIIEISLLKPLDRYGRRWQR
jgi:NitT/TauT family transport system permease protein